MIIIVVNREWWKAHSTSARYQFNQNNHNNMLLYIAVYAKLIWLFFTYEIWNSKYTIHM